MNDARGMATSSLGEGLESLLALRWITGTSAHESRHLGAMRALRLVGEHLHGQRLGAVTRYPEACER